MIRCIAAIDSMRGLATDEGIPWHLPLDQLYFRQQTIHSRMVMGYRTYLEFDKPLPDRQNFVVVREGSEPLREGFQLIKDLPSWLAQQQDDVWVIGGAGLFNVSIHLADELYLTHVEGDFHCTKFFPSYEQDFRVVFQSVAFKDNDISFQFSIHRRKNIAKTKS